MDTFLIQHKDAIENVYTFINHSNTSNIGFSRIFLYTILVGVLASCTYYIYIQHNSIKDVIENKFYKKNNIIELTTEVEEFMPEQPTFDEQIVEEPYSNHEEKDEELSDFEY